MATPRLPVLCSNLLRAVRACERTTYHTVLKPQTAAVRTRRKASLHTSARRQQDAIPQRYGPAASQHLPPPSKPSELSRPQQEDNRGEPREVKKEVPKGTKEVSKPSFSKESPSTEDVGQDIPVDSNADYVDEASMTKGRHKIDIENEKPLENKELDLILSIPSPSEVKGGDAPRHPHLEPSPVRTPLRHLLTRQTASG